jgi:hypothetical protein
MYLHTYIDTIYMYIYIHTYIDTISALCYNVFFMHSQEMCWHFERIFFVQAASAFFHSLVPLFTDPTSEVLSCLLHRGILACLLILPQRFRPVYSTGGFWRVY